MMEEVSDDTNGESTFEFVGDKDEQHAPSVSHVSSTDNESPPVSSSQDVTTATTTTTPPSLSTPSTVTFTPTPTPPTLFHPVIPFPATDDFLVESQSLPPSLADIEIPPSPPMGLAQVLPPVYSAPLPTFYSVPQAVTNSPLSTTSGEFFQQQPVSSVMDVSSPMPSSPYNQPSRPSLPVSSIGSATVDLPIDDYVQYRQLPAKPEGSTPGNNMWGWLPGGGFLSKVAEKAKSSVDTVITTLDPGMKEYIYTGGNIDVVVASDKEVKVCTIREAFQQTFGRATVTGILTHSTSMAAQPVGYSAGLKAAEERISNLRQQGLVHDDQVIVAVENFVAELTPERWYDIGCLVLQDSKSDLALHTYTQATPVPMQYINQMQEQTPSNYPLRWSGLACTVGQVVSATLGVPHNEWHQVLTGVSRKEILLPSARALAGLYQRYLNK